MSTADLFLTFRFWLVLMILGVAGLPFVYRVFHKLPDKGYAFAKMTSLVMTTFVFWLLASYGLMSNSVGGILFAIVVFVGVSIWLYQQTDKGLWHFIRENAAYVITAEAVFTLLFFAWAFVRAQNPQITGTEKPMEFAFLNAVTYSPTYPPLDPWLSGFAISYYYMGYIMMSVVGRLAAVQTSITFNLTVAWLVAGSGIGAYGLVYNLTTLLTIDRRIITQAIKRNAIILGLVASVAIPLAGNNQMLLETLHGNGIGSENFWAWIDVRDIDGPPNETPRFANGDGSVNGSWWWWRSSRVIEEYSLAGNGALEPIAEFPGFSFVLGDIHPHVLAMPYIFMIVAYALTWFLDERVWATAEKEGVVPWAETFVKNLGIDRLLIAAILLGGLAFTNTWDLPIHLFVVLSAFALNRWQKTGRFDNDTLIATILLAILLVVLIFVIYYPFFSGLSSQAGAPYILPMLVQPTRVAHFLVIFGTPILMISIFLIVLLMRSPQEGLLSPALTVGIGLPVFLLTFSLFLTFLIASTEFGQGYFAGPVNELGIAVPARTAPTDFGWGAAFLFQLLPIYFARRFTFIGVTLILGAILAIVVWLWTSQLTQSSSQLTQNLSQSSNNIDQLGTNIPKALPFVLLLIFTATLLIIGPEYVYLKDNFGQRINTIFKFYYQAWILFGVAALVAIGYLVRNANIVGWSAAGIYALLFVFAVRFPIVGAQSRAVEYRGPITAEVRRDPTLDGLVFMQNQNMSDYEAVMWLKDNSSPGTVVLETTGNPYSYYARVSANSGLPTVLGWANHERQWRGDSTDQVGIRDSQVHEIYDTRDWDRASQLLNNLDVTFIYVGSLERQDHDPVGLEKFANNLEVAYQNEGVTIFKWQ
ncbi:MAG: DUF2298 domain-containing protein [Chloroflexota bacterium]